MVDLAALASSSEESEDAGASFAIHDAVDAGRSAQLAELLEDLAALSEDEDNSATERIKEVVNTEDEDSCSPLHLALLGGHVECIKVLLAAHARVSQPCEGSPPLHIASCAAGHLQLHAASVTAAGLLLQHGADPYNRDDFYRTALHWAALLNQQNIASLLLNAAAKQAAEAGVAVATAAESAIDGQPVTSVGRLIEVQDKSGNTALHLAAKSGHAAMVRMLLTPGTPWSAPAASLTSARNKLGQTPLHCAALAGCQQSAQALQSAGPAAVGVTDRRGQTPASVASRRGYADLVGKVPGTVGDLRAGASAALQQSQPVPQTAVFAPQDCHLHLTCPEPITRQGPDPPPENIRRLRVLTDPVRGTLQSSAFDDVRWVTHSHLASLADVLRVHDWSYVRSLQTRCKSLPDDDETMDHLDSGDTAVSHGSFRAALVAAGAVCQAVDAVMMGQARNAFCAVRPPGHHAGPTGIVPSEKDPAGSNGFCLLNNVAIGAAYAMNVYRHAGIKKVAILDFDVHHGNGTQACVSSTVPHVRTIDFSTPFSRGVQEFPIYRPWLGEHDVDNIFFASVQGFGAPSEEAGHLYPGSGATVDSRIPARVQSIVENGDVAMVTEDGSGVTQVADADTGEVDEFVASGEEAAPALAGPHIINVGISGPGVEAAKWRRAWRDKILPAVVAFNPDLILVSAGFDAHKKDLLNLHFVGLLERDYEWVTEQIVQVANLCCNGRVVSVLEGGYRINGGLVSAFGRSVAAHVATLNQPHRQVYDPADAVFERRREAQRQQAAKEEAAELARAAAAAQADDEATDVTTPSEVLRTAAEVLDGPAQAVLQVAASLVDGNGRAEPPPSKRRRRGKEVDYVALNLKMEQENQA